MFGYLRYSDEYCNGMTCNAITHATNICLVSTKWATGLDGSPLYCWLMLVALQCRLNEIVGGQYLVILHDLKLWRSCWLISLIAVCTLQPSKFSAEGGHAPFFHEKRCKNWFWSWNCHCVPVQKPDETSLLAWIREVAISATTCCARAWPKSRGARVEAFQAQWINRWILPNKLWAARGRMDETGMIYSQYHPMILFRSVSAYLWQNATGFTSFWGPFGQVSMCRNDLKCSRFAWGMRPTHLGLV